jgi:hypothetical protein
VGQLPISARRIICHAAAQLQCVTLQSQPRDSQDGPGKWRGTPEIGFSGVQQQSPKLKEANGREKGLDHIHHFMSGFRNVVNIRNMN